MALLAGIELDRKVLAQMVYEDIESFNELASIAKKALGLIHSTEFQGTDFGSSPSY